MGGGRGRRSEGAAGCYRWHFTRMTPGIEPWTCPNDLPPMEAHAASEDTSLFVAEALRWWQSVTIATPDVAVVRNRNRRRASRRLTSADLGFLPAANVIGQTGRWA